MLSRDPLWTLDDLCARVALALAVSYAGQASGRVRDVPDRRTIRYYTTLGLLDRPAEMRGRTALYGLRHLQQLVAIKRLQTHGLSLAEIQTRLLGLNDQALQQLAQIPDDFDHGPASATEKGDEEKPDRRETSFWTTAPASPAAAETPREEAAESLPEASKGVQVSLAPGVVLVLEALRQLDAYDVSALSAAAAPLLKILRARRLVGPDDKKVSTKGETP